MPRCLVGAIVLASLVSLLPPPVRAADVIRPGREEAVSRALRDAGLLCAAAADCAPDVAIEGDRLRVVGDEGQGRYVVRHAVPRDEGCLGAPADLVICPDGPAPSDRTATATAAALLADRPAAAAALARLWGADEAAHAPYVRPESRALDVVLGLWLALLVIAVALALRGAARRDAWLAAAIVAGGAALRLLVPALPSIAYFPAVPEGPFPDVYTVSYPPVLFDSLYRWCAALGLGDRWLVGTHTALGALAPGLAFLAVRRLGGAPVHAAVFALLLAAHPLYVWIARSESYHLWPIAALPAALLGFSLEGRRAVRAVGLTLAALSLVLGAAARFETATGLFLCGGLVLATDPARARRRLLPVAATSFVAGLALLALVRDVIPVLTAHSQPTGGLDPTTTAWRAAARGVVFLDTLTPTWAWAAALLPGLAIAAVAWPWERRWLAPLAAIGGALGAVLPVVVTSAELEHTTNWRYAALALPYVAWWAAAGWDRALGPLVRRSGWLLALAAVPPALLYASALPDLRGRFCWQAEYAFLADALGALPQPCTVTAVQGADGREGIPASFLTLPYAPLQLRYRDLDWRLVDPGGAPPLVAAQPGCQAIYAGAICDQVAQGVGPDTEPASPLRDLVRDARPSCRALLDQATGAPIADTVTPLRPPESPPGLLPDQRVRLRLWRVR